MLQLIDEPEKLPQIEGELQKIEKYIAELNKPQNFIPNDPENAVVALEMGYENLCSMLALNGISNVKTLTVFEFYSHIKYYKNSMLPKK